ncbi:MAG: DNA phosphorothioation system sulfurtransferase DndC [Leptolyngbyaceae bacterium]|nr:DNA phosphorothioation system sulfurtransferase DndC [Leptolyngbyaceae bacterium]
MFTVYSAPNLAEEVRTDVMLLISEIQALYTMDDIPWIVGYSGGKDSTAVLQLVWTAIASLPPDDQTKPVHIISTDTLVENPIISTWVHQSLQRMATTSQAENLPFRPHQLHPSLQDTFWVNLIGKGYPAPRQKFRWCTERMKIHPANHFVRTVVREHGETILVLGTRKAESSKRASVMKKHARTRLRDRLSPNASLPNSLIYSPIEDWTTDHVWLYLMQWQNPWGHSNKDLFQIYRGATADNECPLVVDTSTPSCGSSRFGCWVCTLVDRDKSMEAMVLNDESREWMQPLLDFRDELDFRSDAKREAEREHRDFRRITGNVHLFERSINDGQQREVTNVPGPYLKSWREHLLRRLLTTQQQVRAAAPTDLKTIELISLDELREIRRIWLKEKHEFDDSLPRIYQEITGEPFDDAHPSTEAAHLGADEWNLLQQICTETHTDPMHFELITRLLATEQQYQLHARRVGIFDALEKCFDSSSRNQAEAIDHAKATRQLKQDVEAVHSTDDLTPIKETLSSWGAMKFGKRE